MKMGKCRGMLVGDVKISKTLTLWVSHDPRNIAVVLENHLGTSIPNLNNSNTGCW